MCQQAPGSLKARLAELTGLLADGIIITVEEHDDARRATLGILGAPFKVLYTIIHDDVYHS
jgi:hypothetical protein